MDWISSRLLLSLCTPVRWPGREQGSLSEAASQQLDKHDRTAVVCGVRVGVILRLIDGSSASGSLNQHAADSLACVGLTVSVFISCTHTAEKNPKKTAHQLVWISNSNMLWVFWQNKVGAVAVVGGAVWTKCWRNCVPSITLLLSDKAGSSTKGRWVSNWRPKVNCVVIT